jgi:hypothetical protein
MNLIMYYKLTCLQKQVATPRLTLADALHNLLGSFDEDCWLLDFKVSEFGISGPSCRDLEPHRGILVIEVGKRSLGDVSPAGRAYRDQDGRT